MSPEHDLLFLDAAAVHKIPHRGAPDRRTFAQLVEYVSAPLVREKKDADGGVSLGLFRDGVRRLTHFEGTSLVGLDYDDGKLTPEQFHRAFGRAQHLTYPTFSLTASGAQKSRAIFTLDRVVDLATHRRLMWALYARAGEKGITLDPACKDATRWWFSPVAHPDRVAAHEVFETPRGASPMCVDGLLRFADVLDAAEIARQEERRRSNPPAPLEATDKPSYLRGALERAVDRIRGASAGGRHETLNNEAYSLARLALTRSEVEAVIVPAFVAVAGPDRGAEKAEREARRTIADAFKARGK